VNNRRKYFAELVGTAALLCAVIGSGIMAENLSGGNNGVALIANTLATVFALYVLIEAFGPLSGAHFNPAVSMVMAYRNDLPRALLLGYIVAQLLGAALGAWLAHAMFDLEILQWSTKVRSGNGQYLAEAVATAGLVFVILRSGAGKASMMVASYIGAAYWFTASTSFANPAAVFGRMMSDTFAGINPGNAIQFAVAEVIGAFIGLALYQLLSSEADHRHSTR
jgi:glycerol uptake facilitator-like aquaporin